MMMEHEEQQQDAQQEVQQAHQESMQWAPPFEEAFGAEQITSAAILEEKERMEAWYETWKQTMREKDEEILRIKASVERHQAEVRAAEAEKVALDALLASEIEGRKQAAAKMQALQRLIDSVVDDQETLAEVTRRMEGIRQTADVQDEARNNALEALLVQIEEIRVEYAEELKEIEDEIKAKEYLAINQQNELSSILAEVAEKKNRSAEAGREAVELEEAYKKLEREYAELRASNDVERQKLASKAAEVKKTETELNETVARNALLKEEVAKAEVQRAETQSRHDRARTEFELLEDEHRKMVEENIAFVSALETEVAGLDQQEQDLDKKIAALEENEQMLLEDLNVEHTRKEEFAIELANKERAVEREVTEIAELRAKISAEEARVKDMEEKQSQRKGAFSEEIANVKAQNESLEAAIRSAEERIIQEEEGLCQAAVRGEEYARLKQELKDLEEVAKKSSEIEAECASERKEAERLESELKTKKDELAAKKKTDQKEANAHETVSRQLEQAKDNLSGVRDLLVQTLGRHIELEDVVKAIDEVATNYEKTVKQLKEFGVQIEKEAKQNDALDSELLALEEKIRKAEELKTTLEAELENAEEETQERPQSQPTQGTQEPRVTSMAPPASKPGQAYTPAAKRSRQERAYSVGSSESEYIDASVRDSSVNSVEHRAAALGISRQSRLPVAGRTAAQRAVSRSYSQEAISQEPPAAARGRGRGRGAARGGTTRTASRAKNKLTSL